MGYYYVSRCRNAFIYCLRALGAGLGRAGLALLLAAQVLPVAPAQAALFGEFTLSDEMEMGRQFEVAVKSSLPLVDDPQVKLYVQSVVDGIVKQLPPQPYSFPASVLLHHTLNAFASPGGFVFVNTGLLMNLKHESELAGVLSHEIAHVTQRHIARRVERSSVISIASLLVAIAGVALGGGGSGTGAVVSGAMAAGQSAMLSYSRMDEDDADQFGIRYLVAAGYNPSGLSGAFQAIQRQSWGAGSSVPSYLSTHPDMNARLAGMSARIMKLPQDVRQRKDDDTRLKRVQTLLWARFGDAKYAATLFTGNDALSLMGRGILAARQNRVRDAESAFSEALKLTPDDALLLREAGSFNYDKGDLGLARQQLEKSLKLDPADYLTQFHYARLLDGSGERKAAQAMYRKVLVNVPEDPEVHTYLGRSLGASQQPFGGWLHLAYASLYMNDPLKADGYFKQAQALARTPADEKDIKSYSDAYNERKQYWK